MAEGPRFFRGIHALRAVAAIYVVGEHSIYVANNYTPIRMTSLGVILFFAISGFVIALQRTKTLGDFILHRLLRIYPSYWLAMLTAALAFVAVGAPVSVTSSSLLLYPSRVSDSSLAIPYWTLAFEIIFYVLASFAICRRVGDRALTAIAASWIVIVNIVAAAPPVGAYTFPGFPDILWSPAVQVFPMGVICCIYFDVLKKIPRVALLTIALAALCLSFAFPEYTSHKVFFVGLAASSLVAAVADFDLKSRLLTTLGDASYGIYLMHFPAIIVTARVLKLHGSGSFFIYLAIGLVTGYVFGLLDFRLYRILGAICSRLPDLLRRLALRLPVRLRSESIDGTRNRPI